jgi:UDP-N-acetylmuramoyl-tripeptide--D-alanyl-D-alanine ligase
MSDAVIASPPASEFWTLDRVAAALGEGVAHGATKGSAPLRAVVTDTRALQPGDVFVALKGERFDAHDFLADAAAKGAAAFVVERAEAARALGVPVFAVDDTLLALGRLARFWRRAWGKPVIGVGGSNGKTSTKELIRAALGGVLDVHATEGNLNNRVGVPLTLFALAPASDVAVIEMGTSLPGEIAALRAIAEPDIAVVTSIAEEHLEGLGDLAGVLREESDMFDGADVAIVPAMQPEVAAAAAGRSHRVVTAGLDAGDVRASQWGIDADGLGWIELDGVTVRPPLRGVHNLRNAMLALGVARACGVSTRDAAHGIAAMPVPSMRSAWEVLGQATLINDAYNANPGSTRAAIELLERAGRGRQRVAILGTMRELGEHAERLHRDIARMALDSSIEVVAGVGEFAMALQGVDGGAGRVIAAPDIAELWPLLEPRIAPDAMILVKGSRGVRLERLLPFLTEWAKKMGSGVRGPGSAGETSESG